MSQDTPMSRVLDQMEIPAKGEWQGWQCPWCKTKLEVYYSTIECHKCMWHLSFSRNIAQDPNTKGTPLFLNDVKIGDWYYAHTMKPWEHLAQLLNQATLAIMLTKAKRANRKAR
jgi:hypothetical protein